ncbi:MAG: class I SAM-dependent rRNA methyltransferase [Polyangiales bacterium]
MRPRRDRRGLVASGGASLAVRRGHPWIYREQLEGPLSSHAAGDIVTISDPQDAPIGAAIVDPGSPIAARFWTHGRAPLDEGVIKARIAHAIALREVLVDPSTTACRWVHGEGDRAPGVVIDRYEHVAVVRLDGPAIARHVDAIADAAFTAGIESVVLRSTEKGAVVKIAHVRGKPPPDKVVVREHGVPFVVDLAKGQKTGAFLDQRENRRRVGELARGRRVLNLFSYAGGFSLRAALGGATHVTSVDVAGGAHATAQASFKEAGVDPSKHAFVTADVFDFLERAVSRGEKWDLVVSDPPNMAPSAATKGRAITSYKRLHAACASVLGKGGIFCAASCSSHVGELDFFSTLSDDVIGDRLRIVESAGAGPDHPVLPGFPEGRYLEFCILA